MKQIALFLITILSLGSSIWWLFSCNNRNPNLSRKQLVELASDTTQNADEKQAVIFPDTSYIPPAGAQYTEIRSVDPASPPITLKVSGSHGAKQPLRLSMFGANVEYVKLKLPGENDFFLSDTRIQIHYAEAGSSGNRLNTQVYRIDDHFVTSDPLGVRLFDPSGNFLQNLLMSEFDDQERNVDQIKFDLEGYKRAALLDISGTRCFLTFVDFEGKNSNYFNLMLGRHSDAKFWAGEFDLSKRPLFSPQTEMPDLTPGVKMVPVRNLPIGMFVDDNILFHFRRGNPIGITFNTMGDTLCKFTNYVTESGGAYVSDRSFFYRSDGELFFRQEFCDTIFRVQSANRIVPSYCFDFGTQRLTPSDGANNRTQGKLVPWKWIVFKHSMILIYSEGRDCPNCRGAGEVTFYCTLYDRQTGQPTAIDMQSRYPENILIENDIDGGFPIPLNSLHLQHDELIATFTKNQIEEILKNNAGNIPAETVTKLKTMANTLKLNEMLVILVK